MVKIINIDTVTKTIRIGNADGDIKTWRTTESGTHFPIREGESTKEALDKFVGSKRPEAKKEPAKSETSDWPKSPKFEKLTEQYMPKQGEADNQLGEMLRSINRVVYRYYNDGDMWNKGYGKETVNQAIKHLTELAKNKETPRHIARGLDNALYELKKYGTKDKDRYETALKIMMQTVEWADQSDIDALSKMKTGKKEPASKPMSADHVKQTMQKTMESFPKLYSWEKPHLEKFADDIWSELEKNPGKEQAVLDQLVDAYKSHVAALGMWVDTPTKAKAAFLEKVRDQNLEQRDKERRNNGD